jgi:dTDP-4-amino-4,6-dideoxygalactose transaminase
MNKTMQPIQFIDLKSQQETIREQIDSAIKGVLDHGQYIMGPEVFELEKQLAQFSNRKYVISCASGTDALTMSLMAKQVGPGDAVFVPSFTFTATAEVVAALGATPVFVDVDLNTFNMSVASLKSAITMIKKEYSDLKPTAIIPVDLFGQPADHDSINAVAEEHGLWILLDAAQSAGALYKNKPTLSQGLMAATSFFPAKPLGTYGDGGAIFTDDDQLVQDLRSIRIHGQGQDRNENIRIGLTGRLDTIQAAILLEKLKIFSKEIDDRQNVADYYSKNLKGVAETPVIPDDVSSVWAQYTLKVEDNNIILQEKLKKMGIPTAVYYSNPLHTQPAYSRYPIAPDHLKNTMQLSKQVISLPMHPYLDRSTQDYIIQQFQKEIH